VAPAAEPAAALAPSRPGPDLDALLASVRPPSDRMAALARVLAHWGVVGAPTDDQCRLARHAGLECFDGRGSWTILRRLGIPVAIKLLAADGARHWAAVTALTGDTITLELGELVQTLPLVAVEPLWDGAFSLVWRPLPGTARVLSPGMQGLGVAWLRRALGDGAALRPAPAVYDQALVERVVDFQKREGLEPDGVAGIETLLRLSVRLDERVPLLPAAPAGR
jgi:general secretion pathway protein A